MGQKANDGERFIKDCGTSWSEVMDICYNEYQYDVSGIRQMITYLDYCKRRASVSNEVVSEGFETFITGETEFLRVVLAYLDWKGCQRFDFERYNLPNDNLPAEKLTCYENLAEYRNEQFDSEEIFEKLIFTRRWAACTQAWDIAIPATGYQASKVIPTMLSIDADSFYANMDSEYHHLFESGGAAEAHRRQMRPHVGEQQPGAWPLS